MLSFDKSMIDWGVKDSNIDWGVRFYTSFFFIFLPIFIFFFDTSIIIFVFVLYDFERSRINSSHIRVSLARAQ